MISEVTHYQMISQILTLRGNLRAVLEGGAQRLKRTADREREDESILVGKFYFSDLQRSSADHWSSKTRILKMSKERNESKLLLGNKKSTPSIIYHLF